MDDLAHTLQSPHRNLSDLQDIATKGVFGKKSGKLKPFDNLLVRELRLELEARGNQTEKKDELTKMLQNTLKGVLQVPSLLLLNPTQSLSDLNL